MTLAEDKPAFSWQIPSVQDNSDEIFGTRPSFVADLLAPAQFILQQNGEDFTREPLNLTTTERDFDIGTTTIRYVAEDFAGNIGICSFDVVRLDTMPPEFTRCSETVTLSAEEGLNFGQYLPDLGIVENSALPVDLQLTITPISALVAMSGTGSSVGETEIIQKDVRVTADYNDFGFQVQLGIGIWSLEASVIDHVGLANLENNSCQTSVIVRDVEDPVFVECPVEVEVLQANDTTFVVFHPKVTDNSGCQAANCECPIDIGCGTITSNIPNSSAVPLGPNSFVFTATDPFGNSQVCEFVIEVQNIQETSSAGQVIGTLAALFLLLLLPIICICYCCVRKSGKSSSYSPRTRV